MCIVENFPALFGSVKKLGTISKNVLKASGGGCSYLFDGRSAFKAQPKPFSLPLLYRMKNGAKSSASVFLFTRPDRSAQ
jgi:hypothetical protein